MNYKENLIINYIQENIVTLKNEKILKKNFQLKLKKNSFSNTFTNSFLSLLKTIKKTNSITTNFSTNAIEFKEKTLDIKKIKSLCLKLMPWRKGPFKINDLFIDSEWKSDIKWNRIKNHINVNDKIICDIGTGNGYYLYKLLGCNPKLIIGLDPHPLYMLQFFIFEYINPIKKIKFLPIGWQNSSDFNRIFDLIFCMGVLYHQKNPIKFLKSLKKPLRYNGTLILETLIIEDSKNDLLLPINTYAAMRNIYIIPSIKKLKKWSILVGFKTFSIINISDTTPNEQRETAWSSGKSLKDFLNKTNKTKTIEGYPAPKRLICKLT